MDQLEPHRKDWHSATLRVDRIPPNSNKRHQMHWTAVHRERKLWIADLWAANKHRPLHQQIPPANRGEQRYVSIHLQLGSRGGRPDPANLDGYSKVVLDALTKLGYLRDDDAQHLDWGRVHVMPKPKGNTERYSLITLAWPGESDG